MSDPHGLEEVPWSLHLSHEVGEDVRASISEHCVHDTIECSNKASGIRDVGVVLDRRIQPVLHLFDTSVHQGCAGTEDTSCSEIRLGVGSYSHRQDHNEDVHEDSCIGKPTELLEGPDLAKDHTNNDQDHYTDNVAELEFGDDRKSQSVRDGDKGDSQNQLNALQNVDRDAGGLTVTERYALANVSVCEEVRALTCGMPSHHRSARGI